jgi:hypothetical protein
VNRIGSDWRVSWSPQTIFPGLALDRSFTRTRTLPPRANIFARDGTPLTSETASVYIGIEPSHMQNNKAQVIATLVRELGVDANQLNAALSAPGLQPYEFVPVEQVTAAQFAPLAPILSPVPGIVFQHTTARLAATPDLAAHVIGHVGPATAEEISQLGVLYEPGDVVGQSGIELVYESTLRGTPSGQVSIIDSTGATVSVAKTFTGTPGQAVTTTLDLATQVAAEKALNGVTKPAALVAIQPSTGDILAVVARPITGIDRALESVYPPGSTFKIITSTALLGAGVNTNSPITCPPTVTVDGETFRNFEGEAAGTIPFHRAFAISCNTAFIQLADRIPASALTTAAELYGFNQPLSIGVPAAGGSYPSPKDEAEKVASAIGQGRVTVSPLQMATVAAAVDAAVWRRAIPACRRTSTRRSVRSWPRWSRVAPEPLPRSPVPFRCRARRAQQSSVPSNRCKRTRGSSASGAIWRSRCWSKVAGSVDASPRRSPPGSSSTSTHLRDSGSDGDVYVLGLAAGRGWFQFCRVDGHAPDRPDAGRVFLEPPVLVGRRPRRVLRPTDTGLRTDRKDRDLLDLGCDAGERARIRRAVHWRG